MTRLRRTVAGFARGLIWMACPGLGLFAAEPPARNLPAGYQLLYSQDFADSGALKDFVFSDPAAWRWAKGEAGQPNALELHQQSQYSPRVRSPVNLALIAGRRFGDFDFEAEFVQTGREYGHRDMCVFFGAKDPANFYYVHLATKADPNAHNIFLVNDAPRTNIASRTTAGVNWGLGVWHKVRVERRLGDGSIKVYFDDLTEPVMVASDKHFDYGLIGLGSFDDTGKVARIRVWGPGLAPEAQGFFR